MVGGLFVVSMATIRKVWPFVKDWCLTMEQKIWILVKQQCIVWPVYHCKDVVQTLLDDRTDLLSSTFMKFCHVIFCFVLRITGLLCFTVCYVLLFATFYCLLCLPLRKCVLAVVLKLVCSVSHFAYNLSPLYPVSLFPVGRFWCHMVSVCDLHTIFTCLPQTFVELIYCLNANLHFNYGEIKDKSWTNRITTAPGCILAQALTFKSSALIKYG